MSTIRVQAQPHLATVLASAQGGRVQAEAAHPAAKVHCQSHLSGVQLSTTLVRASLPPPAPLRVQARARVVQLRAEPRPVRVQSLLTPPPAPQVRNLAGLPAGLGLATAQAVTDAQGRFSLDLAALGWATLASLTAQPLGAGLAVELLSATATALSGRVLTQPLTSLPGRRRLPVPSTPVLFTLYGA